MIVTDFSHIDTAYGQNLVAFSNGKKMVHKLCPGMLKTYVNLYCMAPFAGIYLNQYSYLIL